MIASIWFTSPVGAHRRNHDFKFIAGLSEWGHLMIEFNNFHAIFERLVQAQCTYPWSMSCIWCGQMELERRRSRALCRFNKEDKWDGFIVVQAKYESTQRRRSDVVAIDQLKAGVEKYLKNKEPSPTGLHHREQRNAVARGKK